MGSMRVSPTEKLLMLALTVRCPRCGGEAGTGRGLLLALIGDLRHRIAASRIQRAKPGALPRNASASVRTCYPSGLLGELPGANYRVRWKGRSWARPKWLRARSPHAIHASITSAI